MHFMLSNDFLTAVHPVDPRKNLTLSETELCASSSMFEAFLPIAGTRLSRAVQTHHLSSSLAWWRSARERSEAFERAGAESCWAEVTRQLDLFEARK